MPRVFRVTYLFLVFCVPLVLGCRAARHPDHERPLSKDEAVELAVAIANEECMKNFSAAPFDASSYPIELRDGRWRWGALDPAGLGGFSAIVSFDANGNNRSVEVFLSTDEVR